MNYLFCTKKIKYSFLFFVYTDPCWFLRKTRVIEEFRRGLSSQLEPIPSSIAPVITRRSNFSNRHSGLIGLFSLAIESLRLSLWLLTLVYQVHTDREIRLFANFSRRSLYRPVVLFRGTRCGAQAPFPLKG